MKLVKLTEPSEITLEQILLGTTEREQFAIIGRAASALGISLKGMVTDYGIQAGRFQAEANRRGISADVLVEKLIGRIVAYNLFNAILEPVSKEVRDFANEVYRAKDGRVNR